MVYQVPRISGVGYTFCVSYHTYLIRIIRRMPSTTHSYIVVGYDGTTSSLESREVWGLEHRVVLSFSSSPRSLRSSCGSCARKPVPVLRTAQKGIISTRTLVALYNGSNKKGETITTPGTERMRATTRIKQYEYALKAKSLTCPPITAGSLQSVSRRENPKA